MRTGPPSRPPPSVPRSGRRAAARPCPERSRPASRSPGRAAGSRAWWTDAPAAAPAGSELRCRRGDRWTWRRVTHRMHPRCWRGRGQVRRSIRRRMRPRSTCRLDPPMNTAAPPRAVIADDERLMREQLRARLAEVWPELQIVAEARNGIEAVELVDKHRPDLVFLDIRMPGLGGVDAARRIAQIEVADDESLPEIVFITAYDQYAVEAFEQGAADYVLKPAERARLQVTVDRLRSRRSEEHTSELQSPLNLVCR